MNDKTVVILHCDERNTDNDVLRAALTELPKGSVLLVPIHSGDITFINIARECGLRAYPYVVLAELGKRGYQSAHGHVIQDALELRRLGYKPRLMLVHDNADIDPIANDIREKAANLDFAIDYVMTPEGRRAAIKRRRKDPTEAQMATIAMLTQAVKLKKVRLIGMIHKLCVLEQINITTWEGEMPDGSLGFLDEYARAWADEFSRVAVS